LELQGGIYIFTSADATQLFAKHSILMGDSDVISLATAVEIGGRAGELASDVMCSAMKLEQWKRNTVIFGDKDSVYSVMCYTYEGFRDFLSYVNVIELKGLLDNPPVVTKDSKVIDFQVVIAHKSSAGN